MSAWIVEKGHIDVLVQAAIIEGLVPIGGADGLGRALWGENLDSIKSRYEGRYHDLVPEGCPDGYFFHGVEGPLDDRAVAKAIHCYDYQSCEHSEWEASEAYQLTSDLLEVLCERNGGEDPFKGGGPFPWGFSSIEQAVATADA